MNTSCPDGAALQANDTTFELHSERIPRKKLDGA